MKILDQFEFGEANDDNRSRLPGVLDKFERYFHPHRNILFEWYVFWSLEQTKNEPIDMI